MPSGNVPTGHIGTPSSGSHVQHQKVGDGASAFAARASVEVLATAPPLTLSQPASGNVFVGFKGNDQDKPGLLSSSTQACSVELPPDGPRRQNMHSSNMEPLPPSLMTCEFAFPRVDTNGTSSTLKSGQVTKESVDISFVHVIFPYSS